MALFTIYTCTEESSRTIEMIELNLNLEEENTIR